MRTHHATSKQVPERILLRADAVSPEKASILQATRSAPQDGPAPKLAASSQSGLTPGWLQPEGPVTQTQDKSAGQRGSTIHNNKMLEPGKKTSFIQCKAAATRQQQEALKQDRDGLSIGVSPTGSSQYCTKQFIGS